MQLWLQTWSEVETYFTRSQGIIVPIGSTEQHGPNGLIGTDAICAETIARGVGEASGALVAPVISVGIAGHHMSFAGTMTLAPSTLIGIMRDYVRSLSHHGFSRFFFLNGHGGNISTVKAGFAEIFNERYLAGLPAVRCTLVSWWECAGVAALYEELYGAAEGQHTTAKCRSLSSSTRSISSTPSLNHRSRRTHLTSTMRAITGAAFRTAVWAGNSGLSTPAHGEMFYNASIEGLAAAYAEFLNEP